MPLVRCGGRCPANRSGGCPPRACCCRGACRWFLRTRAKRSGGLGSSRCCRRRGDVWFLLPIEAALTCWVCNATGKSKFGDFGPPFAAPRADEPATLAAIHHLATQFLPAAPAAPAGHVLRGLPHRAALVGTAPAIGWPVETQFTLEAHGRPVGEIRRVGAENGIRAITLLADSFRLRLVESSFWHRFLVLRAERTDKAPAPAAIFSGWARDGNTARSAGCALRLPRFRLVTSRQPHFRGAATGLFALRAFCLVQGFDNSLAAAFAALHADAAVAPFAD